MSNILEMQSFDTEQTPEADKKSKVSIRWCNNSKISLALCWIK